MPLYQDTDEIKRRACAFLLRMKRARRLTEVANTLGIKADTLRRHAYGTRWPRLETAMAVIQLRDQIEPADPNHS